MTEKKVNFPKRCRACRHFERTSFGGMCCFILNTGEQRGCEINRNCIRFESVNHKKTKSPIVAK